MCAELIGSTHVLCSSAFKLVIERHAQNRVYFLPRLFGKVKSIRCAVSGIM